MSKDKFKFEKNFYKRHSYILKAINTKKDINDCQYLEIGTASNDVYDCIPLHINNKVGVDPVSGGTHRLTSDEFFKINNNKFDVIFIDGLHEYEQCQKDCINSLKSLKSSGIILIHDCLPKNSIEEYVPRKEPSSLWTGDVLKVAVEIANSKNMKFKIANIDSVVGILIPEQNYEYVKMSELKNFRFQKFITKYYKTLPIVSCEEALDFII